MLTSNQIVNATVCVIHYNSVELEIDGMKLILLGPNASEGGGQPVESLFKIGDLVTVKVIRFNESNQVYLVTRKIAVANF